MKLFSYIKVNCNLTKHEVIKLYNEGKVLVNCDIVPLTCPVRENDIVTLDDNIIRPIEYKYYLYYKPRGILSVISKKENSYINQINVDVKLSTAGRLDKESEGLMILTNDGKFINDIANPIFHLEKEYIVELELPVTEAFINNMSKSYTIKNRNTTPIIAKKISNYKVTMILKEGIYHQIRKIVKMNNNNVISLKRIRIGEYYLDDMEPNEIKEFSPK